MSVFGLALVVLGITALFAAIDFCFTEFAPETPQEAAESVRRADAAYRISQIED